MRVASRAVVLLGVTGLPVLFTGLLTLDVRACLTGAAISGAAVIVRVVLAFRE